MKFEYTGRHIDVTPALKAHVENQFDKIRNIFDGDDSSAHVIIEVEKGRHRAEIIIKWRDQVLTATSTVSDMYQALTQTATKIEKQARKLQNKVKDKYHKAKKASTVAEPVDDVAVETSNQPRILDVERYVVKPMTAEEAALKIESDVNQFVVFRDAENQKISVVYKRKDGNYGLIQP